MDERIKTPVIVVSHQSALRGIRYARCRYGHLPWIPLSRSEGARVMRNACANAGSIDQGELIRRGLWDGGDEERIDLLVGSSAALRHGRTLCCHLSSPELPARSIMKVAPQLFCASPELVLVQCAASSGLAGALALAYEFCASFSLHESDASDADGVQGRQTPGYAVSEPVLSRAALASFLARCPALVGKRTAEQAARYVLDGARSPMEAIMAAVFHLPRSQGGFGLKLALNRRVDFDHDAQLVSTLPYAVCDALAIDAAATIEYNGPDHDAPSSRIHDEQRKLGLEAMGITTLALNYRQLSDVTALEAVARLLYKRAGKRYRNRSAAYRVKQVELLNGLRVAYGLKPC